MRQKYQHLRHLQTAISQVTNKLLTNFQRLESTTIHGHLMCVQTSLKWLTVVMPLLERDEAMADGLT